MNIPIELLPTKKQRVIDLAQKAGIDVSDWSNYKNGKNNPGANPKYCYEWALIEPGKLVVLNLWYDEMLEVRGGIEQHLYLRDLPGQREVNATRRARRKRMEDTISVAHSSNLPIKVIVLGGQPKASTAESKGARGGSRLLDPNLWEVLSFNYQTGEVALRRGAKSKLFSDQFSQQLPSGANGRIEVTGNVYRRSAQVRQYVLERAQGKCEFCGETGFILLNGNIYLETHHIVPLSEGGLDNVLNVVALCPNHHREAHFGQLAVEIKDHFLKLFK